MLSRYFTGIILVILPFVLNILLGLMISFINGLSTQTARYILFAVLFEIIFFTMAYTICVFFMITIGKTVAYILSVTGVNFFSLIIFYVLTVLFNTSWERLADKNPDLTWNIYQFVFKLSPFIHFITCALNTLTYSDEKTAYFSDDESGYLMHLQTEMIDYIPIALITLIIFFILSFILFNRIKSENGDKFLTFTKSERPVQIFFTIASGILIGGIFATEIHWRNEALKTINYIVATFLSVFVVHSIFEIAYSENLKTIFKHKRQLIICFVICFIGSMRLLKF